MLGKRALFPSICSSFIEYLMIYFQEDIATIEGALLQLREAVIVARSDGIEQLSDETDE